MNNCIFCKIVNEDPHNQIIRRYGDGVGVFEPLNPCTPGHLLVVPRTHVEDVGEDPLETMITFGAVTSEAELAGDCNVITSKGSSATQTVFHLHVHIVPRRPGDGLLLPWSEVHW